MTLAEKLVDQRRSGYLLESLVGVYRRARLKALMREYHFDPWHISPKELRPYAMDLIRYINSRTGAHEAVVEIGCGLGEIIRNIRSDRLYGYDINANVINAASFLDKQKRVSFRRGSFENVVGLDIEYLIAVNFMHDIDPSYLRSAFKLVSESNDLRNIIVDSVSNDRVRFSHNFIRIIPAAYEPVYKFEEYAGNRTIWRYSKVIQES